MSLTDNVITEVRLTPNRDSVVVRTGFITPTSYRLKLGEFRFERRNPNFTIYTLRGLESGDKQVILPLTEANERHQIPQQDLFRSIVTGDAFLIKQLTHA